MLPKYIHHLYQHRLAILRQIEKKLMKHAHTHTEKPKPKLNWVMKMSCHLIPGNSKVLIFAKESGCKLLD